MIMNTKIVDGGRIVAFMGVIPMVGVAFIVFYTNLSIFSDYFMQLLAGSVAPGFFIWVLIAESDNSAWGGSTIKIIIIALLMIFACILAIVQVPYLPLYNSMQNSISQFGALIAIFGAIIIMIGALA